MADLGGAEQIDPRQVGLIEEWLEPEEMTERFPMWMPEQSDAVNSIAEAMRTQPRPRL